MPLRLALAAVLAVAGFALVLAAARLGAAEPEAPGAGPWAGALLPPGVPVPQAVLRDEEGARVSLRDLDGPALFTFIETTCRETCPAQVQQLRGALARLERGVPALAIALDPERDTPARARRFLDRQGVRGDVRVLLGERAALERVWRGFGLGAGGGGEHHLARIVLADGRARQRLGYALGRVDDAQLAADVRRLRAVEAAAPPDA